MKKFILLCAVTASLSVFSFALSLEGTANVYFLPSQLSNVSDGGDTTMQRGSVGADLNVSLLFPVAESFELGGNVGLGLGFPLPMTVTTTSGEGTETTETPQTITGISGIDWNVFKVGPAIRIHFDNAFLSRDLSLFAAAGISLRNQITNTDEYNLTLWSVYINAGLRFWLTEDKTIGIDGGVNYNIMLPFPSNTYSEGHEIEIFLGAVFNLDISARRRAAEAKQAEEGVYDEDNTYVEADSEPDSDASEPGYEEAPESDYEEAPEPEQPAPESEPA